MKIKANQFETRKDLLLYIESEMGIRNAENKKQPHTIEGTKKELRRLFLSDRTQVYGITCVCTDAPYNLKKGQKEKVDRGKVFDFGINGRTIKSPK